MPQSDSSLTLRELLRAPSLDERLIVTPLLRSDVNGHSIDLRLGTKFIFTRRAQFAQADTLKMDPRSVHSFLEVHWASLGEPVTLHPHMFMLASTLEYISLPSGVSALISTRSSYARLGTLSVTAPLVHPGFKGCLTLELTNLGDAAVRLTPGLRIAQLTVSRVPPGITRVSRKYQLATEPEFPKLWEDEDREWLQRARDAWERRTSH